MCFPRAYGSVKETDTQAINREAERKAVALRESVSCSVVFDSLRPLWTIAHQAPLSMGCSRQESWSGLPFPSPGDLLDPGIELGPSALQTDSLPSETQD